MQFSSLQLDEPFTLNGDGDKLEMMDTADFVQDEFDDLRAFMQGRTSFNGQPPSFNGGSMDCLHVAGKNMPKSWLGVGVPHGYLPHMAYLDNPQVNRFLFDMARVSTAAIMPYLINAVLPDNDDPAENETHVQVVETMIRLGHAVTTTEAMLSGGEYPRFGSQDEHDAFIGYVLDLRPVHLWLPSTLIPTLNGQLKPMTTARTLPHNDKFLRHIEPILEQSKRICTMYAAVKISENEKSHSACLAGKVPAGATEGVRVMAAMLDQPLCLVH